MVTTTIGAFAVRDYASIDAWEAATDIALPAGLTIGRCYHDLASGEPTFTYTASMPRIEIAGATGTSATRYRQLEAVSGHQYNPARKTGVWIKRTSSSSGGSTADALRVSEDYFRLYRMAIVQDAQYPPTAGTSIGIQWRNTSWGYCLSNYLDWGAHFCDGTLGTAFGTAIERFDIGSTNKLYIHNCIVVGGGSRGNRGCTYGIRYQSGDGEVVGCTVVDVVGHNASSPSSGSGLGPYGAGVDVEVYNCISVCDLDLVKNVPFFANFAIGANALSRGFVSSDISAESYGYSSNQFNRSGVVKEQLFVSAINNDYRLLSSAPAQDWQVLQSYYAAAGVTTDYTTANRSTSYADIGAYDGAVFAAEASPTTVVSTIGAGGDYADPQAWEVATRVNLVVLNLIHIGEMLGSFVETGGATSALVMSGATTDVIRYRELRPSASNRYKPRSDAGCSISTSASNSYPVVSIEEKFFRLTGPMKVTATGLTTVAATGEGGIIYTHFDADGIVLDGVYITLDTTAAASSFYSGVLARFSQQHCVLKNCVIYGHSGADNKSIYAGIRIRDYGQWKIYNNSVFGTVLAAVSQPDQVGIKIDLSTTCEIKNNIVLDCYHATGPGSADFAIGSTPTASCSNNMSSDATAPGIDSLINKLSANTWVNTSARNYYLQQFSEAREAGAELLPDITIDAQRNGRYRPFDMGALGGVKPYPLFPGSSRRRRACHCYEIIRRDGVRLLFTDNNTPITFFGETWSPASMDASARRREIGLKSADLETTGGISSDKITLLDLRAGRYQGARVVEYIVDWRYPHLQPLAEARYTIESTTYDGESWKADVKGLPFILQNKVGDIYGRTCRYILGDGECRAPLAGLTQTGKVVLDVIDGRVSWYVGAATLTSTSANYYGLGKLTWTSGRNQGIVTDLFQSEVVQVNALADPNILSNVLSSDWVHNAILITQVTNGFKAGVDSWNFNRIFGAGEPHLAQSDVGGSATLWADYAPRDTKVCLSVWIRTKGIATPLNSCQLKLLNIGTSSLSWAGTFSADAAGDWEVQEMDIGTTAEVSTVGAPDANWYRLSLSRSALGDEPDKIGAEISIHPAAVTQNAQFSQAQLEVEVISPTSWVAGNKHKLQLAVRADADIANGDTFDLDPGCDKLLGTCKDKFANVKNFGGFPYIPGVDRMFDTPTQ